MYAEIVPSNSDYDYAIYGEVTVGTNDFEAYGVYGLASSSTKVNAGGFFKAEGTSGTTHYGVRGVSEGMS